MISSSEKEKLIAACLKAREASSSPYSDFCVGAALLGEDGRIYKGCNIENAAFTPTVCAERVALFKAVSEGVRQFSALAVCGGKKDAALPLAICAPCGVCRQALREFCGDEMPVFLVQDEKHFEEVTFASLLPKSFGPENL